MATAWYGTIILMALAVAGASKPNAYNPGGNPKAWALSLKPSLKP